MKPFFELNFEAMKERLSRNFGKKRPRWGFGATCNTFFRVLFRAMRQLIPRLLYESQADMAKI